MPTLCDVLHMTTTMSYVTMTLSAPTLLSMIPQGRFSHTRKSPFSEDIMGLTLLQHLAFQTFPKEATSLFYVSASQKCD